MRIGMIGLGKMGGNMRERLRRAGHHVVGYDLDEDLRDVGSLEELVEAITRGDKVSLPGLLTVERSKRSARTGRNPQTGESIEIAAAHTAKVSAGSNLKKAAAAVPEVVVPDVRAAMAPAAARLAGDPTATLQTVGITGGAVIAGGHISTGRGVTVTTMSRPSVPRPPR